MVGPGVTTPLYVSFVCVVSVAWVVSSVSGRYGIGLPITLSGCEATPLRLTMRPSTLPVTSEPSAFFAIGTATQWLVPVAWLAGIAVAPALSACHALASPMSPRLRSAATIVMAPPRFGTSCHMKPLALLKSTGLVTTNVAS